MKRTDLHRPSVINPADYEYVAIECMKIEGLGDCIVAQEERKHIKEHMAKTGGTYSNHAHKGNCMVCGNVNAQYTILFYHAATNSYVRMGQDCAAKCDMGNEGAFRKVKDAVEAYKVAKAGKLKAQGTLQAEGLEPAWQTYLKGTTQGSSQLNRDEYTIADMVDKLVRYGSLSPKQINFLRLLVDRVANADKIAEQRKAEKALAKDCPTGRLTVEAEVLTVKYQASDFGETLKMLVKTTDGYTLWGTVPSDLQLFDDSEGNQRGLRKGDRITLTATISPAPNDSKHGFFKRPIAKLLQSVAV